MAAAAAMSVTPDSVAYVQANPSPASADDMSETVVQVIDLKSIGTRFTFMANDGKAKIKAILSTHFAPEIHSGKIQNRGLVRILNYACNEIKALGEEDQGRKGPQQAQAPLERLLRLPTRSARFIRFPAVSAVALF